jgi:hypothetical protein
MAKFPSQPADYHSFLLRLWRSDPRQPWHASMQSTATGEIQHFATLDHMIDFLYSHLSSSDSLSPQTPDQEDSLT